MSLLRNFPLWRSMSLAFPEAVLDPGVELAVKVELKESFRAQRIVMAGFMDEIRGHFWIKRSHLPRLDRDDVIFSCSKVSRRKRGGAVRFIPGRTTVQYQGTDKSFTRTYLPSSVVYEHIDPLNYIYLRNIFCNSEPAMPATGEGAIATMFGVNRLGNCWPLLSATASMSLLLKNSGDIQVRVRAMVLGTVM